MTYLLLMFSFSLLIQALFFQRIPEQPYLDGSLWPGPIVPFHPAALP